MALKFRNNRELLEWMQRTPEVNEFVHGIAKQYSAASPSPELVMLDNTDRTFANTAAVNTLFTIPLPEYALDGQRIYRFKAQGFCRKASVASHLFTIAVDGAGGGDIGLRPFTCPASLQQYNWNFEFDFAAKGTPLLNELLWTTWFNNTSSAVETMTPYGGDSYFTVDRDMSIARTLSLNCEMSGAPHLGTLVRIRRVSVELL